MKKETKLTLLVLMIIPLAILTTAAGIWSDEGTGSYMYESIRGETVEIYGKGIYRHMSADVAIQGIAQDYVTLFMGIPLLLIGLAGYRRNRLRYHMLLTGTLGYFFVTYLFYTAMAMYNVLFLAYVALLALSFFGLLTALRGVDPSVLAGQVRAKAPLRFTGGFLMFNSLAIALLWLSVVVPPLLNGSIYPAGLQHYTTLIVQGLDLGLMLPLGFVSGLLLYKKQALGYLGGITYIVFLAILMSALSAKIVAMAMAGVNVFPAVVLIPAFNALAILLSILVLKAIPSTEKQGG